MNLSVNWTFLIKKKYNCMQRGIVPEDNKVIVINRCFTQFHSTMKKFSLCLLPLYTVNINSIVVFCCLCYSLLILYSTILLYWEGAIYVFEDLCLIRIPLMFCQQNMFNSISYRNSSTCKWIIFLYKYSHHFRV